MCCSPNRKSVRAARAVRAATLLHEGFAKCLNTGKECYFIIVTYLKQTKLFCFSLFEVRTTLLADGGL